MPSGIKKTENYLEMNKTMNIYIFFDEECQEWIIKALKDHKFLSRKQINELLWSKLPIGYTDEKNRQYSSENAKDKFDNPERKTPLVFSLKLGEVR